MKCLSETELQEYLDGELLDEILNEVQEHLNVCPDCMENFCKAQESKSRVFTFLDELAAFDMPLEVPVFKISKKKRRMKKLVLITSIAASILLSIGIGIRINNQKTTQKQMDNITKAMYEITRNTEPNKMMHDKQIIIVVTNSSGEVIETSITE
ncbi:MAG: zf-HC2 domain-containing protein [Bacteroidota bacterium]